MTDTGVFTAEEVALLGGPRVTYTILGRFDFASGTVHLWPGAGTLFGLGGHDWQGVTDPDGNRMVNISEVAMPEPGVASIIRVELTGIDADFIEAAYDDALEVEGRPAELFIQVFDANEDPIGAPKSLDPTSYMTAFSYRAGGIGERSVSISIEGIWSAKDFPPGARLTDIDQQRRNPGDRVCRFVGWTIEEIWGPS